MLMDGENSKRLDNASLVVPANNYATAEYVSQVRYEGSSRARRD